MGEPRAAVHMLEASLSVEDPTRDRRGKLRAAAQVHAAGQGPNPLGGDQAAGGKWPLDIRVIDTGVAAKWFLPEPLSAAADSVLEAVRLGRLPLRGAGPDILRAGQHPLAAPEKG